MNICKLLGRPIGFQRIFVTLTKSVTGAVLLSQSCYWQERVTSSDGWWWKTQEDWQDETGLSRKELETARRHCARFLKMEKRGIPAKCWYKVNEDELEQALYLERQPSLPERGILDCPKGANSGVTNGQSIHTETTSEITSENTNPLPPKGIDGDIQESSIKSNSQIPKTPHCEAPPLPENLRTPAFEACWALWLTHLKAKRKSPTPPTQQFQLKKMSKLGPARAIEAIENSIEKGWQGIFAPEVSAVPSATLPPRNPLPPAPRAPQPPQPVAAWDDEEDP